MASALPQRVPGASASRPSAERRRRAAGRPIQAAASGSQNQAAMPSDQPDRQPERQLVALGLEQAFESRTSARRSHAAGPPAPLVAALRLC